MTYEPCQRTKISHGQIKRWRHDKDTPKIQRVKEPRCSNPILNVPNHYARILLFRKHLSSSLAKTASSGEIGL